VVWTSSKTAPIPLTILAVLGVMAALYLLKPILIPIALAILIACLLAPATTLIRRALPVGATGAAVIFFVVLTVVGLYLASLTAESLVRAIDTLPDDIDRLALAASHRLNDMIRDRPYLAGILPEPGTIDELGETNRRLLLQALSYRLADLTVWVAEGVVVLFLVLFLLAENERLLPRLVRFFTTRKGDARAAERTLKVVTRQIRAYLVARTLLNIGFGLAVGIVLRLLGVNYALALGVFAGVTNYIPYIGNVAAGVVPVLVALGQTESIGQALIVAAAYLAIVTVEGYLVMPYVLGRSLDLNGTTVLIACLFWGFVWGLMGLILAVPITVSMKVVFQNVPGLNRWAELMSHDWHSPDHDEGTDEDRPVAAPAHSRSEDSAEAMAPATGRPSGPG